MDIWLNVVTEYSEYFLFSVNLGAEWIYCWFNEQIENLDNKINNKSEIKIKYDTVNDFFHYCLEVALDPRTAIGEHPDNTISEQINFTDSELESFRKMALNILDKICENRQDVLGNADYYLGFEF